MYIGGGLITLIVVILLLVLMIPGLLTYLVPERVSQHERDTARD